jgi:hypothetical protein
VVGSAGLVVTPPVVLVLTRVVLVDERLRPVRDNEVVMPGPVMVSPSDLVGAADEWLAGLGTALVLGASSLVVDVAALDNGRVVELSAPADLGLVVAGAVVVAAIGRPPPL